MNPTKLNENRDFSGHRHWPRHRPVFVLMAILLALACGAAVFAYQYKTRWTPLERYYFPAYFRTAHLITSRNPYLRPSHSLMALFVVYPHETRIALNSEVIPALPPGSASRKTVAFALSNEAIHNSAQRLEWRSMRFDDQWLHAWLAHWIYGGQSLWRLFRSAWYATLLGLAVLLPLAIRKDAAETRKRRRSRALKGANISTRSKFHRHWRSYTGVGWKTTNAPSLWERLFMDPIERMMVRVARRHEWEHFLIIGDTGTGKSSLIRQLLVQIEQRHETAIVYDPAREYLPQFLNPDRGDVILNPLDARMPYWNAADELIHHSEAETIAKSLFPDRDRENRFFVESPRKLFAHLLKHHPTPEKLCYWIAHPDPEIDRRVAGTPLEAIVSKAAPQQRAGVLAGLERVSNSFSLLPPQSKIRRWTATEWAERREGWIFLTSRPETRETLRPLMSLWLDFLVLRLTAQTDYPERPVWVIMDELASLETLPTLPLALTESRKSNTRMVLGLQGRSQIEVRYGREAESMLSQPRTKIFLRTSEPRAAEWISKCIGDVEMEHLREGRSVGHWGLNRSENATVDRRIEAAILASEVSNLENLEGYFLTPGYTLKLTFPYASAEARSPGFLPADRNDPSFANVREDEPPEPEEAVQVQKPTSFVRPTKARNSHEVTGDTLPFDKS
ncbi:MAG: type IV secretion system DNA-binding domain-containing protein [Acidobacteriota bacterium]|nr:type IV secretion system DNA-binding domain-containing protein [Acidobacteriota bacterium]